MSHDGDGVRGILAPHNLSGSAIPTHTTPNHALVTAASHLHLSQCHHHTKQSSAFSRFTMNFVASIVAFNVAYIFQEESGRGASEFVVEGDGRRKKQVGYWVRNLTFFFSAQAILLWCKESVRLPGKRVARQDKTEWWEQSSFLSFFQLTNMRQVYTIIERRRS